MSPEAGNSGRVGNLLREDPDAFDALRDRTAERLKVDPGAVEKDYWVTEVLRSAIAPFVGVDDLVFKGGTSLSKAYGIIERFSEDIDVIIVCQQTGHALKRLLRAVAQRASDELGVGYEHEDEGKGFLNARYSYTARRSVGFLTPGVLFEMGSRGGPSPNEQLPIRSLMSQVAGETDPTAVEDYADLAVFQITVLAPERTLAEKLAFLHHRSTVGDYDKLREGARHLYDSAMLLKCDRVIGALADSGIVELMVDIDRRTAVAGWSFTPRPERGFATSVAFGGDEAVTTALRDGYKQLANLVWGKLPTFDEAIDIVRSNRHLL
ncbi:MAG: nucleotidyl transferase AbiEii/AbiGii toxin family protein [Acidimicrobiaceae bacterium]|nr:nucleotidyl transferase AbiEii/AbiGii toxin family protein [Acidimicrobiaceae bacterium]